MHICGALPRRQNSVEGDEMAKEGAEEGIDFGGDFEQGGTFEEVATTRCNHYWLGKGGSAVCRHCWAGMDINTRLFKIEDGRIVPKREK